MWHGSVVAKGLNLRRGPGTENEVIAVLRSGTRFEVLAEGSGWYRVWAGGREGWIFGSPSYVRSERTAEVDLVKVPTPHPTTHPVLLHRRAADAFAKALGEASADDARSLCAAINSVFRPWSSQEGMIRSYEAAIGASWTSWLKLTDAQRAAARKAGFAYHPGFPVDMPHTHVGGGALDLQATIPATVVAALERVGFRRDTPGDAVHWGWHG